MEISQQIIKQAFNHKDIKSLDLELKRELKKLEKLTVEEILVGDKKNKTIKIDSEIRRIYYSTISTSSDLEILKIRKALNVLNKYLVDGITKNDSKSILIFLFANCYFMISPKQFLNQEALLKLSKRKISKEIFNLLFKIKFDTTSLSGAPKNELNLLNNHILGVSENNIEKAYDFVDALERSGRGFHINYLLERLCWFMFYLNYNSYIKLINSLSNPREFIFYFQSLNENELTKIASGKGISSNWANFEIIRQIVNKNNQTEFTPKSHLAVYNRLIQIQSNDFEFLKQTISYFERSVLFSSSLGKFLTTVQYNQLEEIFNNCLIIEKYSSKLEQKKHLLKYFAENSTNAQLDELTLIAYNKWNSFFKVIFNDDNFYTNDLLLTDYCEFVVEYFVSMKTDAEVITFISQQIESIKNIDSIWVKNLSVQTTHFYLFFSKLYLLSYAYKLKKLKNPQVLLDFEVIRNNSIKVSRYHKNKTFETYIDVIFSNFDKQNRPFKSRKNKNNAAD